MNWEVVITKLWEKASQIVAMTARITDSRPPSNNRDLQEITNYGRALVDGSRGRTRSRETSVPTKKGLTYALLSVCILGELALVRIQWVHYAEWKPAHQALQSVKEADLVRKDLDSFKECSARWRAALNRECLALKKEFIVAPDCESYHFLD